MTYTQAVEQARAGRQEGFDWLYQNTYQSKLYLAVKYMGSLEEAQDVLQDAYLKAFSKLDTLQEPERFPAWLGQIVVNTAKNALVKKTPLLFSELAAGDDDGQDEADFVIPDYGADPQVQYSAKETQELVHELIDSLGADQKLCILLYYIEGLSVGEIAAALECSENTVKSRLNYGRKHIKAKAEALQKKGYKLYSLAPLPLLLLLLRTQGQQFAGSEAAAAVHQAIYQNIMHAAPLSGAAAPTATAAAAGAHGVGHGVAVKVVAGILSAGLVAGGAAVVLPRVMGEPERAVQTGQPSAVVEEQPQRQAWQTAYEQILLEAPSQTYPPDGEPPVYESPTVQYALADFTGDEVPELVLRISGEGETLARSNYYAYYTWQDGQAVSCGGRNCTSTTLYTDGTQLVERLLWPMRGAVEYSALAVADGQITATPVAEDQLTDWEVPTAYEIQNGLEEVEFVPSDDLSLLA